MPFLANLSGLLDRAEAYAELRKIDPAILLEAIETLSSRMHGGVRDITRAIERQVTDGLIDARSLGATCVRLSARGATVKVIAADRAEPVAPAAKAVA